MNQTTLEEAYPEIAKQWHPTKNGDLKPSDVTPGSSQRVWWICPDNPKHEWPTRIESRIKGRGCPFCTGKRKFGYKYKLLADAFPDLAAEWHPTKNGGLTPYDVTEGSGKKVWWQCAKNPKHEWNAKVQQRTSGGGKCPYCNNRIPSETTSLAAKYPNLSKQWHPTKNGNLMPENVFPSSKERVWWQCTENPSHEWQAKVKSRITSDGYCKFCLREKQRHLPLLSEHDPELAREWHPIKNKGLTPNDVTAGSSKKVWWICKNDPTHEWAATVSSRTRGKGCPICAGQAVGKNSLANLFPEIAQEWHPVKNKGLTPNDVTRGSRRKVWWQCKNDPSHEWQAFIFNRTKGDGKCPVCSNAERKFFADEFPEITKEWHPTKNGKVSPADVPYSSAQKYWWQCSVNPEHEWIATPQNRGLNQSGCPHCYKENAGQELSDYLVESVVTNTEFYQNFVIGIENINRLAKQKFHDDDLRQTFLRMLFANTITLMETYLSDAFTNTVLKDKILVQALVENTPYFVEMKMSVANLFQRAKKIEKEVVEYLQENVVYHNIWKVRAMYDSVLGIQFPDELENLQRAIMTRHDLIHRNGKSVDGIPVILSKKDIEKVTEQVRNFVTFIDEQFERISNP
jgi:hypothetical protein